MCDRSRGRSGCTRHRMTVRANGSFHVWISGASGCRLPRDVAIGRITNTIATRRFPGTARLPRTCQVIGPRLAVAILHIQARATTRGGSHPVQHHACHTSLDEVPCTNPAQSKTDPALERAPHTRRTGPTLTESGAGNRGATVAILHRTTSPATWRGTTPTPTHDCHKGTSRAVPHPLARSPHQSIPTTPEHPHHAWTSTTPRHPWSSCAGRSPVPRAVVWDPVQPRIATAAELSHCPRLSSWRVAPEEM